MNIQITEDAINRVGELSIILGHFAINNFTSWDVYELFKLKNNNFKIEYCEDKKELIISNDEGLRVWENLNMKLDLY